MGVILGLLFPLAWPTFGVEVIAHRGASYLAPEETQAAYDRALEYHPNYLELDLHRTRDGVIILNHDDDLRRTTNIERVLGAEASLREIKDLNWSDLKQLEAGSWFAPQFAGEPILTLTAFLERYCNKQKIYLEFKSPEKYPGIEEQTVRLLKAHDCLSAVTFQSFDALSVKRTKALAPKSPLAFLFEQWQGSPVETIRAAREMGATILAPGGDLFGREWYKIPLMAFRWRRWLVQAHQAGFKVHIWTLDSKALIRLFSFLGADGYFTNRVEQTPR